MTAATAHQVQSKTAAEVRVVAVSFQGKLDTGELLTGTPTIVEVTTSALTLANKAVSTVALTIDGVSNAIGEAVQFSVTGGTAGVTYTINVQVGTDSTPAQTLEVNLTLEVT